jgi:AraC-like DNA-binding protein
MKKQTNMKIWRSGSLPGVELLRASRTQHYFPKHFHDTYVIPLLELGTMLSIYRGRQNALRPGDIDILEPGVVHTSWPGEECGWSYRCLYISPEFLRHSVLEFGKLYLPSLDPLLGRREPSLFRHLQRAHHHLETDEEGLEGETLLTTALAELVERSAAVPHRAVRSGNEPGHVGTVRAYLDAHYGTRVSLAQLATMVELNPVYLVRSFRRKVGLPPHAYQRQVRLTRARQMLQSGMPVADVACAVGFADQSHLTRVFKQAMGIAPAEYAKG